MQGCGQPHCSNTPYCATAIDRKIPMAEALKAVKPQIDGMLREDAKFHICVDEAVQRRAFLAGMIASEGVYGLEWCRRGVEETKGDLGKMRDWLEQNAKRLNE